MLTNLVLPNMHQWMLTILDTCISSRDTVSNLIEENVKCLVKGIIKFLLILIVGRFFLLGRRRGGDVFGSSGKVGSRHYNSSGITRWEREINLELV